MADEIFVINVTGLLMCITIIGAPFGVQLFKLMKLSFLPFGMTVTKS